MNTKFEAWKIRREILKSKQEYSFYRQLKNKFGEPEGLAERIVTVNGLYHEENSYVNEVSDGINTYRSKKIPKILVNIDEGTKQIKRGDVVKVRGLRLKVTGIVDVQLWEVLYDISLEVEHDGNDEGSE